MKSLLIWAGLLLFNVMIVFGQSNSCEIPGSNKTDLDYLAEAQCYFDKGNCATAKVKLFSISNSRVDLKTNNSAQNIIGCKLRKIKAKTGEAELDEADHSEFDPKYDELSPFGIGDQGRSNVTEGNRAFRNRSYSQALEYYSTYLRQNEVLFRSRGNEVRRNNFLEKIEYCIRNL